jgi:ABC-type branched-subunit amino acid transport system substrate-binding protein
VTTRERCRSRSRRRLTCVVVLVLATSACGARWTDEQRASVIARSEGSIPTATGASIGGNTATAAGGSTPTSAAPGTQGAVGPTGVAGPSSSGGISAGDGGGVPVAGALPCEAPADAPGITDTEIVLGTVSSLSGPVPGLGASAEAAARAYVEYQNATGGVCGRQLVLRTADDGSDTGRNRSIITELGPQVFALAGGQSNEEGSIETVTTQGIPFVAGISSAWQGAPTAFDLSPPFADPNAPIGKYMYLHEQGVRRAVVVYTGVAQLRTLAASEMAQMVASGIEIVNQQELPLSTLSFDSAARGVANSDADYLFFISDTSYSASMARAMDDTGHDLLFEEYVTGYGPTFPELAGPAGEGTTSWLRALPVEDGGTNPEQAAFAEWMAQIAPDAPTDVLAADSWAALHAIVTAMEALLGPLTRDSLIAQLRTMNSFDAGGFFGPIQLGSSLSNGCYVAVILDSGAWRRLAPANGFLC